jgi:hypothetical protein
MLWLCLWWLLFAPTAFYPLEGRIMCGGEPIQEGNIAFEPVGSIRKTGKSYPGVTPGEFSEEFEQFIVPAFNRDSQTRVTMTRAVFSDGMQLDVQGTPLPEPTTPPGRNAAGGGRPAPGPPATRP